jgi:hypothetical protein
MKKIYILASAVVIASSSFAQKTPNPVPVDRNDSFDVINPLEQTNNKLIKKAPGDVIWYENFSNGLTGNSVDGSGNSIGGAWSRGATGADYFGDPLYPHKNLANRWKADSDGSRINEVFGSTGLIPMSGTLTGQDSGAPWMLLDIAYECSQDPDWDGDYLNGEAYLESPEIDLTAHFAGGGNEAIGLNFETHWRFCCVGDSKFHSTIFVGYLNSGTGQYEWTEIPFAGPTNETKITKDTYSIASVVKAAQLDGSNKIKVRFHWNYLGIYFTSYYYWMIDDVKLVEIDAYIANLTSFYGGDILDAYDYYAIPTSQNHPVVTVTGVANQGAADLTGVRVGTTITDATTSQVYNGESVGENLQAGQAGYIKHETGFTPAALGQYLIETEILTNEGNTSTNTMASSNIEITEYEMGHYNPNSFTTTTTNILPQRMPVIAYDLKANGTIRGITLWFDAATTTDQFTYPQVRLYLGGTMASPLATNAIDWTTPVRSQEFYLHPSYIGEVVTIKFDTPLSLNAGDIVWAGIFNTNNKIHLHIDNDGDDDYSSYVVYFDTGQRFLYGADPYINLNFNPSLPDNLDPDPVSTLENEKGGLRLYQNIPNPSENSTLIGYSLADAADVKLEVVDITGKIISKHTLGLKSSGNHTFELNTSDFADGIYYYTLTAGSDRLSNKMVVKK